MSDRCANFPWDDDDRGDPDDWENEFGFSDDEGDPECLLCGGQGGWGGQDVGWTWCPDCHPELSDGAA